MVWVSATNISGQEKFNVFHLQRKNYSLLCLHNKYGDGGGGEIVPEKMYS